MSISKTNQKKLKILGERIKSLRESKGLTLKTLSHSIGKDPQSIHRVEKGLINPTYLYLLQVCEGLEIDIKDLLKDLNE